MFPRAPPAFPLPISIHAPTRGATVLLVQLLIHHLFQSTLPREERQRHLIIEIFHIFYFNPRSHERSDNALMHDVCNVVISIHAPTRGATGIVGIAIGVVKFQSTLPREERQLSLLYLQLPLKFQSTLPREERHGTRIFSTLIINFNPRSHERSDNSVNIIVRLRVISIHAPTRGATKLFVAVKVWYPIFQSTLPREERLVT